MKKKVKNLKLLITLKILQNNLAPLFSTPSLQNNQKYRKLITDFCLFFFFFWPKMQDRGCTPRCDFYWSPLLPRFARPSSSLVFITRVTKDSISIHFCSDWSMRETIVSGVSCAPTARPTASLSTPHLAQTKSVCSALSTRDPQ